MSWAGLASNQLVTFDNLRDGVNTGVLNSKVNLSSIPTGNKIVTRSEVESYVWVNTGASPWSGYTTNRCPPKSSFTEGQWCTIITISDSDIISAYGNTSYPDNTVYVTYNLNGSDYTESFTVAGNYQRCCLPAINTDAAYCVFYYQFDSPQYFTVSSIGFYPNPLGNCDTVGCVSGSYSVLYSSGSCPCSSGTSTTIYVTTTPTWTVGTKISNSSGQNVAAGYYTYAGKCYQVQLQSFDLYALKAGTLQIIGTYQSSVVTSVSNC
ncbi:MAG: hypothetical protein EBR30_01990 [Cytophagia bacterium]|nr:hypothetical protein [Cytophagia bacterium]